MAPVVKNPKDYAVVVGIDEYPGYRSLKGAVADAKDFAKWLCEEEFGGGVPVENCRTVYSVKEPLAPLQDQIDIAFDEIFAMVPPGKKDQAHRLYVYFSGHGMAESNLVTDLCLASWAKKFPNRAIDAEQYLDSLMKLGKFEEIVMFLDCCRVRIVATKGMFPTFTVPAPGEGAPGVRRFVANATEFTYSSYEAATSDFSDEPVVRGYFTRALMAALRGAAASSKGGVTASSLKDYLEDNVSPLAKADDRVQDSEVLNGLRPSAVFGSAPPLSGPGPFPPGPPPVGSDIPPGTPVGPAPRGLGKMLPLTLQNDLDALHLTLRDAESRTVFTGKVPQVRKLKLRPGSYKLRTDLRHATMETEIVLKAPLIISTKEQMSAFPELYSAAPLDNSPTTHEYYSHPSRQWSHQPTRPPLGEGDSSLMIFIRAVDANKFEPNSDLAKGLALLDSDGNPISEFGPSDTRRDEQFGWIALHAGAAPGTYYVTFAGQTREEGRQPARVLPIQVCAEWQTQLFLMFRGAPLFETAKIFFARRDAGFRPYSPETEAADVALNGLQSNRDLLSDGALKILLRGKFENPMLGLVGAHVLLQRQRALQDRITIEDRNPSRTEAQERKTRASQIAVVLGNLNKLLPRTPDVAALNLLAASLEDIQVDAPPMLRPGLTAVMNAAAGRPAVLKPGSLIARIAPSVYADTPWSTWAPVEKGELNWVHFALLDAMRDHMAARRSHKELVASLAQRLRVPQQTVQLAAQDFVTIPSAKLWQALPPEYQSLFPKSQAKTSGALSVSAATKYASKFKLNKTDYAAYENS